MLRSPRATHNRTEMRDHGRSPLILSQSQDRHGFRFGPRLIEPKQPLAPAVELAGMDTCSAGNLRDNRIRLKAGCDEFVRFLSRAPMALDRRDHFYRTHRHRWPSSSSKNCSVGAPAHAPSAISPIGELGSGPLTGRRLQPAGGTTGAHKFLHLVEVKQPYWPAVMLIRNRHQSILRSYRMRRTIRTALSQREPLPNANCQHDNCS